MSLAERIYRKGKSILGLNKQFPFTHTHQALEFLGGQNISFRINNDIEAWRLIEYGEEKEYVVEIIDSLNAGDVFYDVGSSVGLISILAAKKVGNGKVVSFEPDPENGKCLIENYKINGLGNYTLQPYAVGDTETKLELFTQGSGSFSPSLKKVNSIDNSITVDVYRVDTLITKNSLPKPNVIKIDIEGAELMCLKGMSNLLASPDRPRLIFAELHPTYLPAFNTDIDEIFRFIMDHNYKIESIKQRHEQVLCRFVPR